MSEVARLIPVLVLFGAAFFFVLLFAFSRFTRRWSKKEPRQDETVLMLRTVDDVVRGVRESETGFRDLYSRAERKASFLEQYHHAILESVDTGVLAVNRGGQVTALNRACEELLSIREPARGHSLEEVLGRRNVFTAILDRVRAGEAVRETLEIRIRKRGDDSRWIELRTSPLTGKAGQVVGATFLLNDITEKRMLRREGELKERLAAMGEVSAGLAHEFRNAIHSLNGLAKLIRRRADGNDRIVPLADEILNENGELERSLNELLTFLKPQAARSEPVDLRALVEGILVPFREQSGETIAFDLEATPLPEFRGDRGLLTQALRNLIQNGAEAIGDRPTGRLQVRLTAIEPKNRGRARAYIVATIKDNGSGIPERARGKIFTPFFTTRRKGTGLGLPMVQKIVAAHRGSIDVDSAEGRGTTFRLFLPRRERARTERWGAGSSPVVGRPRGPSERRFRLILTHFPQTSRSSSDPR